MSEMSPHELRYDTRNDPAPWSQTFFRGLLAGLVVGVCLAAPILFVLLMSILGNS
jgi:thiol:disulfide interchange protein